MDRKKKEFLKIEAERQLKAIKMIGRWRTVALALSAAGVVVTYFGFTGDNSSLFMKICGIILIVLGFIGAAVYNLGIKNGKNNVSKIIREIEKK